MKKLFYSFALLLMCAGLSAQESLFTTEGESAAKFENWTTDGDSRPIPVGWTVNRGYGTLDFSSAPDRHGNPGGACKLAISGYLPAWIQWHDKLETSLIKKIPSGTAFYYTFWAKADGTGARMRVGAEELYDPKYAGTITTSTPEGNSWGLMPECANIPNEWTKYTFQISNTDAYMDLTKFSFHFKTSGVTYYICDLELVKGDSTVGVEENEFENGMSILSSDGAISINSAGGMLEVYSTMGKLITKQNIEAGIADVSIAASGLYIVKLTKNGKSTTAKAIVK